MNNMIGWQLTKSSTVGNVLIDGSTEIFKSGKWAFLARELIQNSNDALNENAEKLVMTMSLDDVDIDFFPDRLNILKHIEGTLQIPNLPERCKKFSENARKLLMSDTIRVLKISDFNTLGVTGSTKKNDDIDSAWNALIYDEGNSQKNSQNSTGSFGTGKNAPFALSGINTVFYVTKDIEDNYAVEGVAKLFTSYIYGEKIDRKIYFAKKTNDKFEPLNEYDCKNNLSRLFHRDKVGSDVIIFGVDFNKEQIKREIIQSVVENFFVLISDDKLDITVFEERICKDTLWSIIDKYCDNPIEYTNSNIKYGYIKQYLSVYTNIYDTCVFEEDVIGAGKLKLLIAKGNDIVGKWVAMFRNKGMKIFDCNIRTAQQNYSAIFFPGDDNVDAFLKKIENPTHDYFDPEVRIDDKTEKQQAVTRYNQILKWIRMKIEEFTQIPVSENDFLEGMEEYIQLDDSENTNSVVAVPEVEIVKFEPKKSTTSPMVETETAFGDEIISGFKPDDGTSTSKHNFVGGTSDKEGNDKPGFVKDYHNKFKVTPKVNTLGSCVKVAFSLEDYNSDKFNLEIESVGEDNSASDYIPDILEALDVNTGERLTVVKNVIMNVSLSDTNLIAIKFERNFNARYRINVYKMRGENSEG